MWALCPDFQSTLSMSRAKRIHCAWATHVFLTNTFQISTMAVLWAVALCGLLWIDVSEMPSTSIVSILSTHIDSVISVARKNWFYVVVNCLLLVTRTWIIGNRVHLAEIHGSDFLLTLSVFTNRGDNMWTGMHDSEDEVCSTLNHQSLLHMPRWLRNFVTC